MRTTITDLRETAKTYIAVRERVIPTPEGAHLFLFEGGVAYENEIRITGGYLGSGQATILRIAGTRHEAWLQLAAAIRSFSDVIESQRNG